MKLDRNLQREILQKLADAYPGDTTAASGKIQDLSDDSTIKANLLYLEDHGLIAAGIQRIAPGQPVMFFGLPSITARGLDFLADDGGLSAILGVVTIKIHDDTLKNLVEAKILASDLSQPDKKRWLDQLRALPAETTKHLALKLVDLGLANAPAALVAIGSTLGLGAAG